jgi:hypothetical protein
MRLQPSPSRHPPLQKLLPAALAAALSLLAPLAPCMLLGCPRGGGATREAREWSWLVETKRSLDAERDRLATLPPGADAARREGDAARRAAGYQTRLQRYLERHGPEPGQPVSPRERAALHMRSDEAVRAAREFIARAGDYRQAVEICESALALDPAYPPLERQLAAAKADRYVTAERFAKVKPGMAPAEVRGLLGQPNLHDIRDYPQRGLIAWFYPKDGAGAAAAVWFKRVANAPGPVFQADFDALDPHRDAPPPPPPPASTG